jgi:hypothetical protein
VPATKREIAVALKRPGDRPRPDDTDDGIDDETVAELQAFDVDDHPAEVGAPEHLRGSVGRAIVRAVLERRYPGQVVSPQVWHLRETLVAGKRRDRRRG